MEELTPPRYVVARGGDNVTHVIYRDGADWDAICAKVRDEHGRVGPWRGMDGGLVSNLLVKHRVALDRDGYALMIGSIIDTPLEQHMPIAQHRRLMTDARTAMRMIREVVEMHAPPGSVPSLERIEQPLVQEAEVLVRAIHRIAENAK